jgi:transposase
VTGPNKQFMSPFMFRGYCDSTLFEVYRENCLLPKLLPGKIIIADNASFHKSEKARKLIEAKSCQLIFLPAYLPDLNHLNPIERKWYQIKNYNLVATG